MYSIHYFSGEDWVECLNHLTEEEAKDVLNEYRKNDPGTEFKVMKSDGFDLLDW